MAQKKIQPNQLDDSIVTQSELDAAIAEIPEPVLDHGALTGLADDDHTQYHNDTRGDARYNTKAEITTALSGKADTSHTHAQSDVTNLATDLAAKAPLASPALTGTPTAPTPAEGDDSTKIATTAFVQANSGAGYVAQDTAPTDTEVLWYDTDDTGDMVIGNHADTVDGFHASIVPVANMIPVLDEDAKLPIEASVLPEIGRQNNTTNSLLSGARVETGWGVFAQGVAPNKSESVTFGTAFTTTPIVLITYGGDQAGGTIALGNGGNIAKGAVTIKAYAETVNGFTAHVHTNDGTSWASTDNVYYKWMAIGV